MTTLYHGSNVVITKIYLSLSKPGKDFGKGFYLNPNAKQAMEMARRTVRRLTSGEPIVNAFEFDDSVLAKTSSLKIKTFDDYSEEWAQFILTNRNNRTDSPTHDYDIVIGPIANDTVGVQLHRFIKGYITIERMIEELKFHGAPAIQYFFGTEAALQTLKKI